MIISFGLIGSKTFGLKNDLKKFVYNLIEKFNEYQLVFHTFGTNDNEFNVCLKIIANEFNIDVVEYKYKASHLHRAKDNQIRKILNDTDYFIIFPPISDDMTKLIKQCNKPYKVYDKQ